IVDGLSRFRIDRAHHRVEQRARREILPGAPLHLLRVPLQQSLVARSFDVDAEPEPSLAIDQADEAPELRLGSRSALSEKSCRRCRRSATAGRESPNSAASTLRPAGRATPASGNPRASPLTRPEATSPARSSSILRNKRCEICEI